MHHTRRSRPAALLAVLAVALSAAACGDGGDGAAGDEAVGDGAAAAPDVELAGICPDPLVVQADGPAAVEHAAWYQLVGPDGEMADGRYTGPLGDTGIDLVILGGGPGLGPGQRPLQALTVGNQRAGVRADLALVGTDELVAQAATARASIPPAIGVVAPVNVSPLVLFWGPDAHPDGFDEVDDIADLDPATTKVVVRSTTEGLGRFLLEEGVPAELLVPGDAGDPQQFVASGGAWLSEGVATREPWLLEDGGGGWGRPVEYAYAGGLGFDTYPAAASVSSQRLGELGPCLELLVPLVQRAQVDYVDDPGPVNELLAAYNERGFGGPTWRTPVGMNGAATELMLADGLVGNGDDDVLGEFDLDRVEATMEVVAPGVLDDDESTLTPDDVVTNAFVDESIGLPAQ